MGCGCNRQAGHSLPPPGSVFEATRGVDETDAVTGERVTHDDGEQLLASVRRALANADSNRTAAR